MAAMKERLATQWAGTVVRRTRTILAVALVATVGSAAVASQKLGINTDTAEMLSPDVPFRQALTRYRTAFPENDVEVLVVVEGTSPELTRNAADRLTRLLRGAPDIVESVFRATEGAFFEESALLYRTPEELDTLLDRLDRSLPFLESVLDDRTVAGLTESMSRSLSAPESDEVEGDPTVDPAFEAMIRSIGFAFESVIEGTSYQVSWEEAFLGEQANASGLHREFIEVRVVQDFSAPLPAGRSLTELRRIANTVERRGIQRVRARVTGPAALEDEEMRSVTRGGSIAGAAALVLVLTVLGVGLRSAWLVSIVGVTLLAGLTWTAAFASVAVGTLNVISVAFAVLFIGLGVDYAIHFVLHYRALLRAGEVVETALARTFSQVGPALVLCAATTSIGFFAFLPTDYRGVAELGLIAGVGMYLALVASLVVLPALLALHAGNGGMAAVADADASERGGAFGARLERYRASIRTVGVIVGVGGLLLIPRLRFDPNPNHLRDPAAESVQTFEDLLQSGPEDSPWTLTVLTPDSTSALDTAERLDALSTVGSVRSIYSFLPTGQPEKVERLRRFRETHPITFLDPSQDPTPSSDPQREAEALRRLRGLLTVGGNVAEGSLARSMKTTGLWAGRLSTTLRLSEPEQGRLLLERLDQSVFEPLEVLWDDLVTALRADGVTRDDIPPELEARWIGAEGTHRLQILPAEDVGQLDALQEFVGEVGAIAPEATDLPAVYLGAGQEVVKAFGYALMIALAGIGIVLFGVFRNPSRVIQVLLPLILAGGATGGLAYVVGLPMNFANIIVLPLLFGLGVDNGIHIVHRFRVGATARAIFSSTTARGVLLSGTTTLLSFSSLAFTSHRGMATLGQLLSVGVFMILAYTLIVLPAFLVRRTA